MKPSSIQLHDIRIAPPQEGDSKPEAIVQLGFEFNGPGDRIGPSIQMAVAVEYAADRTVPALIDAALDEALRLLEATCAVDRSDLREMIEEGLRPRAPT